MFLTTERRVGFLVLSAIAIFFSIGFYIGYFRFSTDGYYTYQAYFVDSAGVQKKGEVKIAGVKVGWIDEIYLIERNGHPQAQITLCVDKKYILYADAYAVVKQDGILGAKFIEIIPGDFHQKSLENGDTLKEQQEQVICMEELIEQAQHIVHDIHDVHDTLKKSFGTGHMQEEMHVAKQTMHQVAHIVQELHDAHLGQLAHVMHEFTQQAQENLKAIYAVTQKIDKEDSSIAKFMQDTTLYDHITQTSDAVHTWIQQLQGMRLTADSYIEILRASTHQSCKHTKTFFNLRLHPRVDYFFQFQVIASEQGFFRLQEVERIVCLENNMHPIHTREETYKRHRLAFGFQFGKIMRDVFAIRLGIIESTAGIGFDLKLPIPSNNVQWISTVELFDFQGFNRENDRRVHGKWLNRLVLFKNIYLAFGADDFISRKNGRTFVGAGIFFNSDTINHFFPDYHT